LLKSLDEYNDSIVISEEVLTLDPERSEAWLIMGRSYGAIGKNEEYKQCLRKYLHKRPDDRSIEDEMKSIS
jgi:tetratricopeptide (TPR) repeat protein